MCFPRLSPTDQCRASPERPSPGISSETAPGDRLGGAIRTRSGWVWKKRLFCDHCRQTGGEPRPGVRDRTGDQRHLCEADSAGRRIAVASDPLAAEHAALNRWVQEAIESVGAGQYWKDVELKSLPSGRILLEAPPEQARRYLLAALAQARQRDDPAARYAGRHTVAAVRALLRRGPPPAQEA